MGDVAGRLFREFAVTLAATILLSAAVSLSLTPMLCATILVRREQTSSHGRFFEGLLALYARALDTIFVHRFATLMVAIGTLVLTCLLYIWTSP